MQIAIYFRGSSGLLVLALALAFHTRKLSPHKSKGMVNQNNTTSHTITCVNQDTKPRLKVAHVI